MCGNESLKEVIHATKQTYQQSKPKPNTQVHNEENKRVDYNNPFENIPLGGNDDYNTPPRTPRFNAGAWLSPPRQSQSHHESDDEITSDDVIKFQQDELTKKLMLKALEKNGDQYFQYMATKGWKLPQDFDVKQIIQKLEPTKAEILREEM